MLSITQQNNSYGKEMQCGSWYTITCHADGVHTGFSQDTGQNDAKCKYCWVTAALLGALSVCVGTKSCESESVNHEVTVNTVGATVCQKINASQEPEFLTFVNQQLNVLMWRLATRLVTNLPPLCSRPVWRLIQIISDSYRCDC